ncbi:hypothetical protein GCM10009678_51010 [Actinomadura kijaniata]|uniref:Uncharacterized protein n=1 Tax=Actinomadura namibiensis TaxID=182080 RepID=A0A7W3LHY9_ACTNM|nr:hypothetical protein [Actinomadura namibiensis]MBA8948529.1 hypothetical protein [Actinomadura namibiensis]
MDPQLRWQVYRSPSGAGGVPPERSSCAEFSARPRVTRDFCFAYRCKGDATRYMDAPPKNVFVGVR